MSKIQAELALATGVNLARGESIIDVSYLKRLIKAVADLKDPAWNDLSKEAQDWFNDAADKANAKKDIPAFPDAESDDDEKPRTRRRSAEPEPEQAPALKKDDVVTIVTGRGKEVTGTVVDPDDKGELVLMVGEGKDAEEIGYDLSKLQSITVVKPPKVEADEEKPRRRRAAEDDEPAVVEPEVSDSVEVTTQSGRTKLGNIVEISDDTLVIKDAAGEEIEYARSKVKSIVVKVKNAKPAGKAGDDDEKPRRRAAARCISARPARASTPASTLRRSAPRPKRPQRRG